MRLDTWNPGPSRRQMPRAALVSPLSMDNQVKSRINLCPRVFISMSILTDELFGRLSVAGLRDGVLLDVLLNQIPAAARLDHVSP